MGLPQHPHFPTDQLRAILAEFMKYDVVTRGQAGEVARAFDYKLGNTKIGSASAQRIARDAGLKVSLSQDKAEITNPNPIVDETILERVILKAIERENEPVDDRIAQLSEAVDRSLRPRELRTQPRGTSWRFYAVAALIALGLIVFVKGPQRTAEQNAIEGIKQGQKDVCERWGDLRPECR